MLTYSLVSNAARSASLDRRAPRDFRDPRQHGMRPARIERGLRDGARPSRGLDRLTDGRIGEVHRPAIEIVPAGVVSRHAMRWDGLTVEIIRQITHDNIEFRYHAPCHLLLVYEEGVRAEGETLIGDSIRSSLRTLRRKLTFVPAGHEYRDWQLPNVRSRIICFYFDTSKLMETHPDARETAGALAPRLLFEDTVLWEMAIKLAAAIEDGFGAEGYCEALGVVITHELVRALGKVRRRGPLARGGLAVWQQRIVASYIEEHSSELIPLATLARLVNLSSYHFCRAFKQSFGAPPHRYHISRRIERAKTLLANPAQSVTEIAGSIGFSETSAFSAAFRNATGTTPTEYRRTVG